MTAAYKPHTVWQHVAPWPADAQPAPSPFDCSGPSRILSADPHAFKQRKGHNANMPQMVLPGSPKYGPPGMMRGPVWRKNDSHPARDAFIVSRRDAGETYKTIAQQVGVSIARCSEIYKKKTRELTT